MPPPAPSSLTSSRDPDLEVRLHAALDAKGPGYVPRTRHRNADGSPQYVNRLILESSPYLLQHAHNPVDWFPWGDEAFERARALGRPVFLSVGYSTCHWCHVMEEESFEDEAVARYMNERYVCIKVDREERPDVDAVYMAFLQSFRGQGGWPMNVWLTPSREPFFGGTYFPPRAGERGARLSLLDVLTEEAQRFANDPSVVTQASQMAAELRAGSAPAQAGDFPSRTLLESARAEAARRFDPIMGGARGAPKFPSSFPVRLLLRIAYDSPDRDTLAMATSTLDHMRDGGIADQIGGGFHRYSTDARWLVPHFEKMLYDNALLAVAYLEAAESTGAPRYGRTVREILDYLLRDMVAPNGTFYSATDADSPAADGHLEEGAFFTWTKAELDATLGVADGPIAAAAFGVTPGGEVAGRSVLHVAATPDELAKILSIPVAELSTRLDQIRAELLRARTKRPAASRDEKVILGWNALAVSALARAGLVLGDERYASAALRAALVLIAPLREARAISHLVSSPPGAVRAFSDDLVLLAAASLDVFELTGDARWLDDAASLMESVEQTFADEAEGGYFSTIAGDRGLLLREKPDRDGPVPSVSSVAALTWLRLYAFTDDLRYRERAERTIRAFSRALTQKPLELDQMLIALDWATGAPKEIAIVVPDGSGDPRTRARPLLDVLANHFVPSSVLVVTTEARIKGDLGHRVAWLRDKTVRTNLPTAYICERGTCQLPTTDPEVVAAELNPKARP